MSRARLLSGRGAVHARASALLALSLTLISGPAPGGDDRIAVQLPSMMREHMLSNMRDHLLALEEITRYLADEQYDDAAELAENRLGLSSLDAHGASHMGKYLPPEMGQTGMSMHRAASRFALAARNAEVEGGLNKAFSALSEVMQQCVACHAAYRID